MNKYKELLYFNMNHQLSTWFDQNEAIPHEEVRHFLHSLKGTSGTIGLNELHDRVQLIYDQFEDLHAKNWSVEELKSFLIDLIKTNYTHLVEKDMLIDVSDSAKLSIDQNIDQPLVLILDDDVALLMYLKDELEKAGWTVIATVHPQKATEYFHALQPDCFMLDLHIPEVDGFQVIEMLSEKLKRQYVPTMIISHDNRKETRLKAFRMGIDDLMCKPLDIDELLARLGRQLNNKRRQERLLFIDELTGAYNRKYMHDLFNRLVSDMKRTQEPFSLALLDLDHFKQVNDTYGHLIGDEVLRGFTAFIKSQVRANDCLIRYGGEEFVLVFPRTGVQEAKQLLTRLIEDFSLVSFSSSTGEFFCSFSAGVTLVTDTSQSSHAWLESADAALYQAKSSGRRRVVSASDDKQLSLSKRKLNVVIVDDDAMIRTLLSDQLMDCLADRYDPDIKTFKDGESFFDEMLLNDSSPYLIILDGMMPRMDGLEVLQNIRLLPNKDRFTVIMLTGRKSEQDIVKALQWGADDYVTKPFSVRELEARIKRLMYRVK